MMFWLAGKIKANEGCSATMKAWITVASGIPVPTRQDRKDPISPAFSTCVMSKTQRYRQLFRQQALLKRLFNLEMGNKITLPEWILKYKLTLLLVFY